jgi:hypothetical protein
LLENDEHSYVQEDFSEIQKTAMNLCNHFVQCNFKPKVAERMQYDESTQFTETNIGLYLGELEEYFATLITYIATERGRSNPTLATLPFEQLNTKDFN